MMLPIVLLSRGACTLTAEVGCFVDSASHRVLPHTAYFGKNSRDGHSTLEMCAEACCADGYAGGYSGAEYGAQCFCAKPGAVNPAQLPKSTQCSAPCPGNKSETCGGANAITIFSAKCSAPCRRPPGPAPPAPPAQFYGCEDANASSLPYCDESLSDGARAADLVGRLSLQEKISLLSPTHNPFCAIHTPPVPRLGLPPYKWLTETNSAVDSPCVGSGVCPTTFIGPQGMGASFNRSSWRAKGAVVGTEMRAMQNMVGTLGLTGFGRVPAAPPRQGPACADPSAGRPNINVVKDPRYGRNSEVPGEDPFLSGQYAAAYVHGMQQRDATPKSRLLISSYLKHYTEYNVETSRFTFTHNVSQFSMWDSYLPAYRIGMQEGFASGVMCSYFAPNGTSVCGNEWLLDGVLRKFWGRPDAVVESDCSAVANMVKNHYAANDT